MHSSHLLERTAARAVAASGLQPLSSSVDTQTRFYVFSLVLFAFFLLGLVPLTAHARPYQGYVLKFELTPDNDGNVVNCTLRRATRYAADGVQDPADFIAPAVLIQDACSTFSHWKLEVRRDRRGNIEPADAPWPCFVRDDTPDKVDCHPSGRQRVPID